MCSKILITVSVGVDLVQNQFGAVSSKNNKMASLKEWFGKTF